MSEQSVESGARTTINLQGISVEARLPSPENPTQAYSIIQNYAREKVSKLTEGKLIQQRIGNGDLADKLDEQIKRHMAMAAAAIDGDPKQLVDYISETDIHPLERQNAQLATERDALPDDEKYNQLQEELQLTQLRRDAPQANPALAAIDTRIYKRIQGVIHNETSKGIKDREIAFNLGIIAEYQRVIEAANMVAQPTAVTTKLAA
jgi:hypothetical protein